MTDKCHTCLLGLIILSSLLKGTTGEETHVFSSSGESVSLPCNKFLSDCTSTTWIFSNHRVPVVELFAGGIKKNDIERHERLSLGSDCSLNIYKATKDDHGSYTCRQYVNGQKHGNDARVSLHVLQVSSSSTQSEMRTGSSVTLSCQLYLYDVSCDTLFRTENIQLFWENQMDVNLQTDSRYRILSLKPQSGNCISTLTTTLLNEDTEWRCLVKKSNETKISASYTAKIKDIFTSSKDSTPNTSVTPTPGIVISAVIAALALLLPAVLWVVCKKRAVRDNSVVTDKNDYKGTYETINISPPTSNTNEQNNDVTYCEVTASSKQQMTKNNVQCDDKVTYATIKGASFASQDEPCMSL